MATPRFLEMLSQAYDRSLSSGAPLSIVAIPSDGRLVSALALGVARWLLCAAPLLMPGCSVQIDPPVPSPVGATTNPSPSPELGTTLPKASARQDYTTAEGVRMLAVAYRYECLFSVHPEDRVALAKQAAIIEKLDSPRLLGKDAWRMVYAVIAAETAWMPRTGMGNNGKESYGIAQMEAATARALGINPHLESEATLGVARALKEAVYSYNGRAIGGLTITSEQGAVLPRENALKTYISVYYNTSTAFKSTWTGDYDTLYTPTKSHIKNLAYGLNEAKSVEAMLNQQKDVLALLMRQNISRDVSDCPAFKAP